MATFTGIVPTGREREPGSFSGAPHPYLCCVCMSRPRVGLTEGGNESSVRRNPRSRPLEYYHYLTRAKFRVACMLLGRRGKTPSETPSCLFERLYPRGYAYQECGHTTTCEWCASDGSTCPVSSQMGGRGGYTKANILKIYTKRCTKWNYFMHFFFKSTLDSEV